MFDAFFAYTKEREEIRKKREDLSDEYADKGEWPWTEDPILQVFSFCNVYREDDRTTRWYARHIRASLRNQPRQLLAATIVYRMFNRIETAEVLQANHLFLHWDPDLCREALVEAFPRGPYVTGSFIINSPNFMSKLDGVIHMISSILQDLDSILDTMQEDGTMEGSCTPLTAYPHVGMFQAYEIVTDLSYTFLQDAPDRDTWCNVGPGARRGVGRLLQEDHTLPDRLPLRDTFYSVCEQILDAWKKGEGPHRYCGPHMREVEHTLCEFDKYMRVKHGEGKPRRLYRRRDGVD